jgi:hypothetical protein
VLHAIVEQPMRRRALWVLAQKALRCREAVPTYDDRHRRQSHGLHHGFIGRAACPGWGHQNLPSKQGQAV